MKNILILIMSLGVLWVFSCFVLALGGKSKISLYIGWGLRVVVAIAFSGMIILR